MTKMGFYFNEAACIGCRTCQIACKDTNDYLGAGETIRTVTSYETGAFPSASTFHLSATCNHCDEPACVAVCPVGAMYVDEADGTVQHDDDACIGCKACTKACPYGNSHFIESLGIAKKCDACAALRATGANPACVDACPMRALEFGPIDELRAANPDAVDAISVMPDPRQTSPCVAMDARENALSGECRQLFM